MTIFETLLNIISLPSCFDCGVEGKALCDACQLNHENTAVSSCVLCNQLTDDFATCVACRQKTPLTNVWATCDYEGQAVALIQSFKFEGARHFCQPLAEMMTNSLPYFNNCVVVPVPTAARRKRQRGFDQSEQLAKEISHIKQFTFARALVRTNSSRQLGAGRKQRWLQAEAAFRTTKVSLINRKNILLVDDVATTGATLTAAAKELKRAGARSVAGVVFARD